MLNENQKTILAGDILRVIDWNRENWKKDPPQSQVKQELRGTLGRKLCKHRWSLGGNFLRLCVGLGFIVYYDSNGSRAIRIGLVEDNMEVSENQYHNLYASAVWRDKIGV
jgi:hypothetical protein